MQNGMEWRRAATAASLLLAALAGRAQADSLDFSAGVRNLSPVAGLFAVAPPLPPGDDGVTATLATASHSVGESAGAAAVLFDGETSEVSITVARALGAHWRVSATLPYLWHSGGTLDGFIDDWHAFFGFPDGIRDEVPRDQLRFQYRDDGSQVVDLTRNRHGPGDVRFAARWSPPTLASRDLALAFGVKLPTGSASRLTGSGATDVSAALHWQRERAGSRWSLDASAGLALLGDADLALPDQRRTVWIGHFGAAWRVSERLALGARLQAHQGLVGDAPAPLSDVSVIITTGGSLQLGDRWRLDIAVDEDVNVETAPDVVLRVGLARRFD